MPFNDNGRNASLSGGLGNAIAYISLHTGIPDASGSNESTGGSPSYARRAVTWGSAASGVRSNSGALTNFDIPASTVFAFGFWSAITTGTFYGWAPLNGSLKSVAVVEAADLAGNVLNAPSHGLAADDRVIFSPLFGGSLPTGLSATTAYFVRATGLTTDEFTIATTSGGAAVDITGSGACFWQKIVPEVFAAQGQVSVASAALVLDALGM